MCGRSACTLAPDQLKQSLHVNTWCNQEQYKPCYNVGPNGYEPVMYMSDSEQILRTMRWGLVPSFWKEPVMKDFKTINARSETLTSNSLWKRLLKSKRCVVIADGYYEWKKQGKARLPYYIHYPKGKLLKMAGLYDCWKNPENEEELYTFTVVTMDAAPNLASIHDRMPAILESDDQINTWIDCENHSIEDAMSALRKLQSDTKSDKSQIKDGLQYHRVAPLVNSWKNQSPQCIVPIAERKGGIESYFTKIKKTDEKDNKVKKEDEEDSEIEMPELEDRDIDPDFDSPSDSEIKSKRNVEEVTEKNKEPKSKKSKKN